MEKLDLLLKDDSVNLADARETQFAIVDRHDNATGERHPALGLGRTCRT